MSVSVVISAALSLVAVSLFYSLKDNYSSVYRWIICRCCLLGSEEEVVEFWRCSVGFRDWIHTDLRKRYVLCHTAHFLCDVVEADEVALS